MQSERPPITFSQWLTLSVMAFHGEGVRLKVDDIARDVKIAAAWVGQWQDDPVYGFWASLVLSGHLFIGVGADGKVAFRPSGKPIDEPPADARPGEAWAEEYLRDCPDRRANRCRCPGCQGPPICRCCNSTMVEMDMPMPEDLQPPAPPSPAPGQEA